MYRDKAGRKRRGFREVEPGAAGASPEFPELTETDIHRAAAGIL
jgi:hypothetical protein